MAPPAGAGEVGPLAVEVVGDAHLGLVHPEGAPDRGRGGEPGIDLEQEGVSARLAPELEISGPDRLEGAGERVHLRLELRLLGDLRPGGGAVLGEPASQHHLARTAAVTPAEEARRELRIGVAHDPLGHEVVAQLPSRVGEIVGVPGVGYSLGRVGPARLDEKRHPQARSDLVETAVEDAVDGGQAEIEERRPGEPLVV